MSSPTGSWLRCKQPRPQARFRLVCLPHAGGSAPFFAEWYRELPETIEVHAVAYPGRTDRYPEPLIEDAGQMAEGIAGAVESLRDKPIVLFGHSMGALIAYETARLVPDIAHLFVSGANAPHAPSGAPKLLDEDDAVLVRNLAELGGADTWVLEDEELRELLLPIVRADLRLAEWYEDRHTGALRCPVTACIGESDTRTDSVGAGKWAELTAGAFELRGYPGGHFYLEEQRTRLLSELAASLG